MAIKVSTSWFFDFERFADTSALRVTSDRGLDFTAQALRRSISDKSEELSTSFTKAYETTLKQYHSFVVRPIFAVSPV